MTAGEGVCAARGHQPEAALLAHQGNQACRHQGLEHPAAVAVAAHERERRLRRGYAHGLVRRLHVQYAQWDFKCYMPRFAARSLCACMRCMHMHAGRTTAILRGCAIASTWLVPNAELIFTRMFLCVFTLSTGRRMPVLGSMWDPAWHHEPQCMGIRHAKADAAPLALTPHVLHAMIFGPCCSPFATPFAFFLRESDESVRRCGSIPTRAPCRASGAQLNFEEECHSLISLFVLCGACSEPRFSAEH